MAQKDNDPEDVTSRLQRIALTKKLALGLFLVPVLIAFGTYFTEIVAVYRKHILPLDPWNREVMTHEHCKSRSLYG